MGIVFRQSFKATIVTFAGALLGAFIIFFAPRVLPLQELGFTRVLTTQALILSAILALGANNTLSSYLQRYPDGDPRKAALVTYCFLFPGLAFAAFAALYLIFPEAYIALFRLGPGEQYFFQKYLFSVPVFTLIYVYIILLEQYLNSHMKTAVVSFLREIVIRLFTIALLLFYALDWLGFSGLVWSTVLLHLLPAGILAWQARRYPSFRFSTGSHHTFLPGERREVLRFSGYHALLNISSYLLGMLDALLLLPLSSGNGLEEVTIYTTAVFLVSVMLIPYKAMSAAATPTLARALHEKDQALISSIFNRTTLNILVASVLMAVLIGCNLHNAVALLGPEFRMVPLLTGILIIGRLADLLTGMNDYALSLSEHYRLSFYMLLAQLLGLVALPILLVPFYGVLGTALASTATLLLYNVAKFLIAKKKLGVQPFQKGTAITLLAGVASFGTTLLLPRAANPFMDAVLRSTLAIAAYGGLIIALKPSPDVQHFLKVMRGRLGF